MNEALIRELLKYKLNAADIIINSLPSKISGEIKNLGRVILESVNEGLNEMKEQPASEAKRSDKLDNVPIE